jgi:hypothetical protein
MAVELPNLIAFALLKSHSPWDMGWTRSLFLTYIVCSDQDLLNIEVGMVAQTQHSEG